MSGSPKIVHPREVADKSVRDAVHQAIDMALENESEAVRHNTKSFNNNRYLAIKKIADYNELKDRAREIKEISIKNLPVLITTVIKSITRRGGHVFFAKSKHEAADYIKSICRKHDAKLVVKAKSITSEEIELNSALQKDGVEVAETDLAEFILQISKEQPSHIVAPAIHKCREQISKLFKEHFNTDAALETGEELTEFSRLILREKFLSADIGISGANLIAADEGTILLVESEGNIRLTTQLPAVHIAIAGIEKIIQSKKDFGIFIELLAASATGQSLTSYTNIIEPPLQTPVLNLNGRDDKQREFHLVLLDNGRMDMRQDNDLKEALYCIRCSACMNVCANFQAVGGHAFGGECYTGGIGGAWTIGTSRNLEKGKFAELCTGCSRCIPNCPVRIDIPGLNTTIKNRLIKAAGGPSLQKMFFGNFSLTAKYASLAPGLSNWITNLPVARSIMERVIGFDSRRHVPEFAAKTLVKQYKEYRSRNSKSENKKVPDVVLFADVYTNYNNPPVGMAAIKIFDYIGLPITLSKVMAEGRAAQSQGLIELASRRAVKTANYLEVLIDEGKDIVVAEPSVLALFRSDYKKLINNERQYLKLQKHTYDPIEYLNRLSNSGKIMIPLNFNIDPAGTHLFYHSHCQLKSIGAGNAASEFFQKLGFTIDISSAECCGMAGSFGYKKEYYDLTKNIGHDLAKQIKNSRFFNNNLIILASGTSCREQISDDLNKTIYHPIEFLEKILIG